MSNDPADGKPGYKLAAIGSKNAPGDKSPPILTISSYYATRSLRAKKFVDNFRKSAIRTFSADDREEAHRLRKDMDAEYSRTLELAIAGAGASTGPIAMMILSWVADVIRRDSDDLSPGFTLDHGSSLQTFRSLSQSLKSRSQLARSTKTSHKYELEKGPSGVAEVPGRTESSSTSSGKSAAKERNKAERLRANYLLLTFLYLAESRGLSIVDARSYLADALKPSNKGSVPSAGQIVGLLATLKPDRLVGVLGVIGQWDEAVTQARNEARQARTAEASVRADVAGLQSELEAKTSDIDTLRRALERAEAACKEVERLALAERQRLGANDRQRRGRLFRFLSEKLVQRIEITKEALAGQPPVVDIAMKSLQEIEKDCAEESKWLKSSE